MKTIRIGIVTAILGGGFAYAQQVQGPLQAQNSLSELATNGTQTAARANITAAKSGANSDITSLTGLSTPLSAPQGGTGVNNGAFLLTMFGSLTTAGGQPITLTATGTTNVTLPTSGTLFSNTSSIPNANLSPLLANQLLGALTATTPSGQTVPSCTGANAALQWTSGVGFGCVTIATGVSSPGGVNTDVQFNNLTAFGGNSSFTYNGTGGVTVGTSGSVMGTVSFNNPSSGSITLSPPTGALGTVTDTLPLGGTLLTSGQASASFATLGANSNITSLSGLTTPLSPFQGGTGVQNANANTYTSAEPVNFTGGFSAQLTTTGATTVTLPTSGTLLNNMSTANNTILGTTSSNLINDLPIPNCVGTGSAIQWTTGTGFSCGTITGTAATPGGGSTDVQFNNSGIFGGNGGFIYDGTSQISLGVPGTSLGKVMFNSSGSGSVTVATPSGALGGALTDLLPLGGTLLSNTTGALAGANSNITSLSGLTTPLSPMQGGTGIQNSNANTLTLAGPTAFSGANSVTLTSTGTTNVTLPTSGTLFPGQGLINVQVFTASGTYTPTAGVKSYIVEEVAQGGGGGGCAVTTSTQNCAAGSGGAGSYAKVYFNTAPTTETVTISNTGAGGAAGDNNGTPGGTTSFGSLISCPGGQAGSGSAAASDTVIILQKQVGIPPAACTISSGLPVNSVAGGNASPSFSFAEINANYSAIGGSDPLGMGGSSATATSGGNPGLGFGAGGSGGATSGGGGPAEGASPSGGEVVVYEYN